MTAPNTGARAANPPVDRGAGLWHHAPMSTSAPPVIVAALSTLVALAACSTTVPHSTKHISVNGGVSAVFTVPASLDMLSEETFFDQPWPSDLRVENGLAAPHRATTTRTTSASSTRTSRR